MVSETADALEKRKNRLQSFQSKISKILDKSPSLLDGVIKKREIKRGASEGHS